MLQAKVDTHMRKSQAQYKSDYSCLVCETPSFQVDSYVFFSKPPLATTSKSFADALARSTYNKLHRQKSRPHRILEMRASTITIDEHDIPSKVSIDRVTHAPLTQNDIRYLDEPHKVQLTDMPNAKSAKPTNQLHTTYTNESLSTKSPVTLLKTT